jgi:dTDP-glucose pyrophosphorylase
MKVVMPMAGRGSRYSNEGYKTPKPLIEIHGKPMFAWALESLKKTDVSELLLVALREHAISYGLQGLVDKYCPYNSKLLLIDDVTEGQLCTVLVAEKHIDTNEDVLIVASDTLVESGIDIDIRTKDDDCKGLISVADMPGESWSFAKTDVKGNVVEVAEKKRISDNASTGLYYFSNGSDLVSFGKAIIETNERTRGEFYVIPVYQKMISAGCKIQLSIANMMWDMGTPEAKKRFETYLNDRS